MKYLKYFYLQTINAIKNIAYIFIHPRFLKDYFNFNLQSENKLKLFHIRPIYENTKITYFDTHYVYHSAWACRVVKLINPEIHIDISSTLFFSSNLSAFIKTEFYDYRPANLKLSNLKTGHANLIDLHFKSNSIKSLSCMHTIEHIGLGRYGDKIDPKADFKAITELKRVLQKNGNLLLVVPIGKSVVKFNNMRIYDYNEIMSQFKNFTLNEFLLIPDNALEAGCFLNPEINLINTQEYACGCFWFKKN